MSKKYNIMWYSFAAMNAYFSAMDFSSYVTKRSIILKDQLSKAPELTDKVFEAANKTANELSEGRLWMGLIHATVTGLCLGLALSNPNKKEEQTP